MEIITKNAGETQAFGEKIGRNLISQKIKSKIFCLYGDLGAGKTTFIQGLAKGLGIKKRITSPTFMFVKQYEMRDVPDRSHLSRFYHIDLYRIEKTEEADGLGLEEIFNEPKTIIAIEWAERIKKILPKERTDIYFQYLDNDQRKINFISTYRI